MTYRINRVSLLAASIAAVLGSAQAYAAPADEAAASELGEIVVTARQREEKITDVPVTVQAFTAADIKAAGIERPTDFIALTAGVSQVQTAEVGDMQVSIRGINTGRDAEANFALVMDGVLQTNPNALNQELASVTQIEILKGPQGALYGRNAVAGAMIISTRKPTDEFAADISVGGGNFSSYKGNFWVGGPVNDNLKLSASGYWRKTDGQWENITLGCDDCVDYFEEKGGTVRAVFDLWDGEFDVKAKYSKLDAGAINFNASIALSQVSNLLGAPAFYENTNDHVFSYVNNVKPQNEQENKNFSIKFDRTLASGNKLTAYFAFNDQTNYFLTDGTSAAFGLYSPTTATATLPAMASCTATFANAFANVPLNPPFNYNNGSLAGSFLPPYDPTTCSGYQYQQRDQQDKSLELRLASPGDQRLRWIAGFYYADVDRRVVVSQGSDLGRGFSGTAFVPSTGLNPTDLLYDDNYNSKVTAAFGQLAYDLAPGVELAFALRYDEERRSVSNNVPTCTSTTDLTGPCRAQTAGFSGGTTPFINPTYTADPTLAVSGIPSRQNSYSQLQPKLSLNWKFNEDFSTYASYGYGFRSGGFNSTGSRATIEANFGALCLGTGTGFANLFPPSCAAPGAVRNIQNVNDDYKKEVSKAAEIGFKSFFADRTVQLNAAVFQTKVDNMLFFNFFAGPFGLLRAVTNIDKVTIKGAEMDARWKINDMFSVFAGYSYVNGEIKKHLGRPYTQGNEVPYAPKYTGNAGVDVNIPFGGSDLAFVGRVDASFTGETWFHPVQDETVPNLFGFFGFGQGTFDRLKRDAFVVANVRAGVQAEKWSVMAWSRNVTDEKYHAEVIPAPEFGGAFIHDAPGRSYGVDLSYRF